MWRRIVVGVVLISLCASPCVAQSRGRTTIASRLAAIRDSLRGKKNTSEEQASEPSGKQDRYAKAPLPYDPSELDALAKPRPSSKRVASLAVPKAAAPPIANAVRRSPDFSSRGGELDEALSDMFSTVPDSTKTSAATNPAPGQASLSSDEQAESLPSYLQGILDAEPTEPQVTANRSDAGPAQQPVARRRNPFDLHPALVDRNETAARSSVPNTESANVESIGSFSTPEVTKESLWSGQSTAAGQSTVNSTAPKSAEAPADVATAPPLVETTVTDLSPSESSSATTTPKASAREFAHSTAAATSRTFESDAQAPVTMQADITDAGRQTLIIGAVPGTTVRETQTPTSTAPGTTGSNGLRASDPAEIGYTTKPTATAPMIGDHPDAAAREAQNAFSAGQSQSEQISAESIMPTDSMSPADNVLFSYDQPVIRSHVQGPRRIVVGREAVYRVVLQNTGESTANKVLATVKVPSWAEVVDATSTSGVVQRNEQVSLAAETHDLQWRLHDLPGRSQQTLELKLIPRTGRPLQLGVHWTHAAVGAQAMVEVQEPKLAMMLTGPSDVLFGRPQRYKLTISNPGTGTAEDVTIRLTPPGGEKEEVINHTVGLLAPGQSKALELELTARDAGELMVQASAQAAGNLTAETVKNVVCRKPELQIEWRGPEKKYAGTNATYYFRVRNPGTAATEPFTVKLDLPKGAEFISASEGHRLSLDRDQVTWQGPALAPGQERFLQLRCQLNSAGKNAMELVASTPNDELRDTQQITTNVVALADLKLDVADPRGPLPVGEVTLYEIRVVNRGSTAARDVNVAGLFSAGIEPISVEGAQHSIRDGRVSFQSIDSLPAGREITLKIRAKAKQPGTHIFRAEVHCADLEIKLAAEETTRFFTDERRWKDASTAYSSETANR